MAIVLLRIVAWLVLLPGPAAGLYALLAPDPTQPLAVACASWWWLTFLVGVALHASLRSIARHLAG